MSDSELAVFVSAFQINRVHGRNHCTETWTATGACWRTWTDHPTATLMVYGDRERSQGLKD